MHWTVGAEDEDSGETIINLIKYYKSTEYRYRLDGRGTGNLNYFIKLVHGRALLRAQNQKSEAINIATK